MVESNKNISMQLKRTHDKIQAQFDSNEKMEANALDVQDLSRHLVKMAPYDKQDRKSIEATMDLLFEIAAGKMKDAHDKEVLQNLRKLVG